MWTRSGTEHQQVIIEEFILFRLKTDLQLHYNKTLVLITDGREDTFFDLAKINSYGEKNSLNSNDVINNYGDNSNLRLDPERQKNASDKDLKYILFWNEAYGSKVHAFLIKF